MQWQHSITEVLMAHANMLKHVRTWCLRRNLDWSASPDSRFVVPLRSANTDQGFDVIPSLLSGSTRLTVRHRRGPLAVIRRFSSTSECAMARVSGLFQGTHSLQEATKPV